MLEKDIYFSPDINDIINKYKKEFEEIYILEKNLKEKKISFSYYDKLFQNINVIVSKKLFIIIINNKLISNIESFNNFFIKLKYHEKLILFSIFTNQILKKYIKLDFSDNNNFNNLYNMLYKYFFNNKIHKLKYNIFLSSLYMNSSFYENLNNENKVNNLNYNCNLIINRSFTKLKKLL